MPGGNLLPSDLSRTILMLMSISLVVVACQGTPFHVIDLPSVAKPFYTSSSSDGIFAAFHSDGNVSFTNHKILLFTAQLDYSDRGTAYQVVQRVSATDITVITTTGAFARLLTCSSLSNRCQRTGNPIHIPITGPSAPIIYISSRGQQAEWSDKFILISKDTVIFVRTSSVPNQPLYIPPYGNYSFRPEQTLDIDLVTGAYLSGTGTNIILMIAYASTNEDTWVPGMITNICWNNGQVGKMQNCDQQHKAGKSINTYMMPGPINFMVSESYPSLRIWSTQDSKFYTAWIHAYSSSSNRSAPVDVPLTAPNLISPTMFGEYALAQVAMFGIGEQDALGWSRQCLKLRYNAGTQFGVKLTTRTTYPPSSGIGVPFLAIQPDRFVPSVTAVAKTARGYGVVTVDFGDCPSSSFFSEETPLKIAQSAHSTHIYPHQKLEKTIQQTCRISKCTLDHSAECEGSCWNLGSIEQRYCCK